MAIVLPKFSRRRSPAGRATEAQPAVNLTLCRDDATYPVGSTMTIRWKVSRIAVERIQSMELSVLWHTEGKGDEDLYVHHFYRIVESQIRRHGLSDLQSTQCVLPQAPLSYQGRLVSVRWCVRLRIFLIDGRDIVTETPFHLVSHAMANQPQKGSADTSVTLDDTETTSVTSGDQPLDSSRIDSPSASASSPGPSSAS